METLLLHLRQRKPGLLCSNVVERVFLTRNDLNDQKLQQRWDNRLRSWNRDERSSINIERDSGSFWYLIQIGAQHFTWRIRYQKAELALSATFAYVWSKAGAVGHFTTVSWKFLAEWKGFFKTFYYCWQNLGPPVYSGDEKQRKRCTAKDDLTPKKAKAIPSVDKVMATVFWDSYGVIFVDYLEKVNLSTQNIILGSYNVCTTIFVGCWIDKYR